MSIEIMEVSCGCFLGRTTSAVVEVLSVETEGWISKETATEKNWTRETFERVENSDFITTASHPASQQALRQMKNSVQWKVIEWRIK